MLSDNEIEKIFKQKKQRIERTVNKNGIVKEKLIEGFEKATLDEFKKWHEKSNYSTGCYYCSTSAEQTLKFYEAARDKKIYDWTRGGKRGKRLEVDRKDPTKKYDDLKNLVWACYWCNNAKSNFFTETDFMPIANAIGAALKKISKRW